MDFTTLLGHGWTYILLSARIIKTKTKVTVCLPEDGLIDEGSAIENDIKIDDL